MGVKSLVQGLNAAATEDSNRGPFDLKSDAVTDWPPRPSYKNEVTKTITFGHMKNVNVRQRGEVSVRRTSTFFMQQKVTAFVNSFSCN